MSFSRKRKVGSSNNEKNDEYTYRLDSEKVYSNSDADDFESSKNGFKSPDYFYSAKDENGNDIETPIDGLFCETNAIALALEDDSFENNDSFADATSLYDAGSDANGIYWHSASVYATISQKKKGWGLWEQKYIDKDFYSFDMVSKGTLTIGLTQVPNGCDYDIRLYKLTNSLSTSYSELDFNNSSHILTKSDSNVLGGDEHIQLRNAMPGTYYIVAYSYLDKYYDDNNSYKLEVQEQVNIDVRSSSYSISSGRNSGDLFAIWQSDFMPLGINAVGFDTSARQSYSNYDCYPMIRHLADRYTSGNNCNYLILYVWDIDVRSLLYSYFQAILQSLNDKFFDSYGNEVSINEDEEKTFNIVWNSTELAVSIAGLFGKFVPVIGNISTYVGIVMSVIDLIKAINPENLIITKRQFRDYLINIISALEVGVGTSDKEVIMIKFQYRFYTENGHRYIDWSPTYDGSQGNKYSGDTIKWQVNGSGMDGKVKSFSTKQQIDVFLGVC